jgi:DNA-directed RNA polymerase subunit RPC12/RpoP
MERESFKTTKGATKYRPVITDETELGHLMITGDMLGFCVDCGAEAYGVEPDARRYECEDCGARGVYGLAELLMMGLIKTERTVAA